MSSKRGKRIRFIITALFVLTGSMLSGFLFSVSHKALAEDITLSGSCIEKRMTVGSNDVPDGAVLTWQVEAYDGNRWSPAAGIEYMIFDEKGAVSEQLLATGNDGKIVLNKTADGYPKVKFADANVYLNLYKEAKEGDLRLTEVSRESDDAWGMLAGYGTAADDYAYSLDISPEEATAIVGSNRTSSVEVEKQTEDPSDDSFTMILEQVISVSEQPVTAAEQIISAEPGARIDYTVFVADSGEQVRTGMTGSDGQIIIKGGEYAKLDLPDGTSWTLYEKRRPDYSLRDLSGEADGEAVKLENNFMLLRPQAEVKGVLDVQAMVSRIPAGQPVDKENFLVSAFYSDGSRKIITADAYTIEPEISPGMPGPAEFTVRWPEGNMEASVTLNVTAETVLTKEMIDAGVKDAQTGLDVPLDSGAVTIPEYIIWQGTEYCVVGIEAAAFQHNYDITEIHFPDSLRTIGDNAFNGCSILSGELKFPESLTGIGGYAFWGCGGLTGKLVIPDSVTEIGYGAFRYCTGFTDLTLPAGLTVIDSYAFGDCSFTGELIIPEGVRSIGEYAFGGCSGFTGGLTLPDTVTAIGNNAFQNCSGFTGGLTLPAGLTSIESHVFSGCSGLTGDLIIPEGVDSIGYGAFMGCSGFTGRLFLPEGVKNIGDSAFGSCTGLSGNLIIPEGVADIGYYAFQNCWGFDGNLVLPASLRNIGEGAFMSCSRLAGSLTIPEGVISIGRSAFNGCGSFTGELYIPNSVTEIGSYTFEGTRFTAIIVDNVPDAVAGAPWGCYGMEVTWLRSSGE